MRILTIIFVCLANIYANELTNLELANQGKVLEFSIEALYGNAHIVVKSVIWFLVLFSIISWSIFIYKIFTYTSLMKGLKNDAEELDKNKSFEELSFNGKAKDLYEEISDELVKTKNIDDNLRDRIKQRLKMRISILNANFKKNIAFLASVGSSAPFIGLFGTVWGIMHSFIDIANNPNPSLSVVAPGIAEALFATALGLVVAIPAVLLYNYLAKLASYFMQNLGQIAVKLDVLCDRELLYREK